MQTRIEMLSIETLLKIINRSTFENLNALSNSGVFLHMYI